MCGLAGIINYRSKSSISECRNIGLLMAQKLEHRGPDDFGLWQSKNGQITFSHQRLSIQDLSNAGHQPMISKSKKLVLEFNGEIYNHLKLRRLFEPSFSWIGGSDTETLIALFEKYGVEKTVELIEGMFVIALWDEDRKELYLIRDRFGEKPLYYLHNDNHFIFASELKALKVTPWMVSDIDLNSLTMYFQHSFVPGKNSIYQKVSKLIPGEILKIQLKNNTLEQKKIQYWSSFQNINSSKKNVFSGGFKDASLEVEKSLRSSVKDQLVADVPVGVFLSGGIDSSLITMLASQESSEIVRTFNIGFEAEEYDESNEARALSNILGTNHTSINFSSDDVAPLLKNLHNVYDEPFADAAQMPTIILSMLAKKSVSVALSGDGGDEFFGGYTRYISGPKILNIINFLPSPIKKLASKLIRLIPPSQIDLYVKLISPFITSRKNYYQLSRKLYALSNILNSSSEEDLYNNMRFFWKENLPIDNSLRPLASRRSQNMHLLDNGVFSENMMSSDVSCYLPDDLCVKLDRASMSTSLETRLPFLNRNLFHLAWSLPMDYKINSNSGKLVLRDILNRNLPGFNVPVGKQGFTLPLGKWLRGELKEWASDLLSYNSLRQYSVLDTYFIRGIWTDHLSQKNNYEYDLWSVLVFIEWARNNKVTI